MAKQLLRYGLTSALRPFDIPENWTGTQSVNTTLSRPSEQEKQAAAKLNVRADTLARKHASSASTQILVAREGTHTLEREISGAVAANTTIIVKAGVKVTITETVKGRGALALSVLVIVEEGAECKYQVVQELEQDSLALLAHEAQVSNANHEWFFLSTGGEQVQTHFTTYAQERTNTITRGVILANRKQQVDSFATTINEGERSTSDMLVRAVVDDKARAVLHGLITIAPSAPECDSYQKAEVILLGEESSADAIPNLEIGNHRVRCSHGASIGKLDAERLFYLTSRGLSEMQAKKALTEGFVSSIIPSDLTSKALDVLRNIDYAEE
jgi:Fe-S cluster assembly scaffold protein SufB